MGPAIRCWLKGDSRRFPGRGRGSRPRRVAWGAFALWIGAPALVLLTVWQQASVDRLVVSLERERDVRTQLESQVNALRVEADRLSSLGQVEARAIRELGMERPTTEQIVDLTNELQRCSPHAPLLISMDQEGGGVSRLPNEFTIFPRAKC